MTATILRTLKQSGYKKWISLEMKEHSNNSIETLGMSAKKLVEALNFVA